MTDTELFLDKTGWGDKIRQPPRLFTESVISVGAVKMVALMKSPQLVSLNSFAISFLEYLNHECVPHLDGKMTCVSCQTEIEHKTCFVSVHASDMPGCAGSGRCIPLDIPYCPKCESEPEDRGCVHVPMVEAMFRHAKARFN